MSKEEPQVEWGLGMMLTLVHYTASSTWETIATLQRGKHMARITPATHNFGSKISKRAFQELKITHPPHPCHLLQYSIPIRMLQALAELKCRAIEHSTASNRGPGCTRARVHQPVVVSGIKIVMDRRVSWQRWAKEDLQVEPKLRRLYEKIWKEDMVFNISREIFPGW